MNERTGTCAQCAAAVAERDALKADNAALLSALRDALGRMDGLRVLGRTQQFCPDGPILVACAQVATDEHPGEALLARVGRLEAAIRAVKARDDEFNTMAGRSGDEEVLRELYAALEEEP